MNNSLDLLNHTKMGDQMHIGVKQCKTKDPQQFPLGIERTWHSKYRQVDVTCRSNNLQCLSGSDTPSLRVSLPQAALRIDTAPRVAGSMRMSHDKQRSAKKGIINWTFEAHRHRRLKRKCAFTFWWTCHPDMSHRFQPTFWTYGLALSQLRDADTDTSLSEEFSQRWIQTSRRIHHSQTMVKILLK